MADTHSILRLGTVECQQNDKLHEYLPEIEALRTQLKKATSALNHEASENKVKAFISRKKSAGALQNLRELEAALDRWQLTLNTYLLARLIKVETLGTKPVAASTSISGVTCNQSEAGTNQQQRSICHKGGCLCPCHLFVAPTASGDHLCTNTPCLPV